MLAYLGDNSLTKANFGSKAYNLSFLAAKGYPVPQGFALSFDVFNEYLEYNNNPFIPENYLENNIELQQLILQGNFPEAAINELKENLKYIDPPYAIRSSAFCEDTAEHSMAGLFESFTCIGDFAGVTDAVKKCYASSFSDRVLEYFHENNINMKEIKMAVLIQHYLSGTKSGVVFTADTTQMDPGVICISVVNGPGSDFVSGKSASSLYKIVKETGELIIVNSADETEKADSVLLYKLFRLSTGIENLFAGYQDIEWTCHGNDVYILQARPITTFKEKEFPIRWDKAGDEDFFWFNSFPEPLKRIYWDLSLVEQEALSSGAESTGNSKFYFGRTIQNGYVYLTRKPMQEQERKKEIFDERISAYNNQGKNLFFEEILPELESLASRLKSYYNRELTTGEAIEFLDISVDYIKKSCSFHWPADACIGYTEEFKDYIMGLIGELSCNDYRDLIYGRSIATDEREELIRMGELVKCSPELIELFHSCEYDIIIYQRLSKYINGEELNKKINEYVKCYGVCIQGGNDIGTIAERLECVIAKIREVLNLKLDDFLAIQKEIYTNRQRVEDLVIKLIPPEKNEEFLMLLNAARLSYLVSDTHTYYIDRAIWGYWRLAVKNAGKMLEEKGIIHTQADIFYMTMNEIREALSNGTKYDENIKKAKELYSKQRRIQAPGSIGKILPVTKNQSTEENACSENTVTQLEGVSTFRGEVKGRVFLGYPSSEMKEGSIPVLYWGHGFDALPFVSRIKGIIFQNGSPFDHTGIITRELNIPAVYYVKDVMTVLKTGDMIKIDGKTGKIYSLMKIDCVKGPVHSDI